MCHVRVRSSFVLLEKMEEKTELPDSSESVTAVLYYYIGNITLFPIYTLLLVLFSIHTPLLLPQLL